LYDFFPQKSLATKKRTDAKCTSAAKNEKKLFIANIFLQLFKEDPDTGLTHVALSSDSTCINHLYSSQDGYETLHLEKLEPPPAAPSAPEAPAEPACVFPDWMQGKWEDLTISGGEVTYRDETNFVTYRGKCLESLDRDQTGTSGLRYLLHLQTDCGAPSLNCALFHRRDANVMEFQLGKDHIFLFAISNRSVTRLRFCEEKKPPQQVVFFFARRQKRDEIFVARSADARSPAWPPKNRIKKSSEMFVTIFSITDAATPVHSRLSASADHFSD
jgi:hypothetical protein